MLSVCLVIYQQTCTSMLDADPGPVEPCHLTECHQAQQIQRIKRINLILPVKLCERWGGCCISADRQSSSDSWWRTEDCSIILFLLIDMLLTVFNVSMCHWDWRWFCEDTSLYFFNVIKFNTFFYKCFLILIKWLLWIISVNNVNKRLIITYTWLISY